MTSYSFSKVAQILQAKTIQATDNQEVKYLITDSRNVPFPEQSLFFAIKGANHNGHDFIPDLYEKQVRNFVVSQPITTSLYPQSNFIQVPNTINALQKLVTYHRQQFVLPTIGITGSNGKTIIKEWLFQLLWKDYYIVRSPKSYNSQVGVPLSVWQLAKHHELAIFEAGISKPNEMIKLSPIIRPTIGIFTNLGTAHDQGFLNKEKKIKEKLLLFKTAKKLLYGKDYEQLHQCILNQSTKETTYLTWSEKTTATLQVIKKEIVNNQLLIQVLYQEKLIEFTLPFTDKASFENAILCCLLLLTMGYNQQDIKERMQTLTPVAMRLELKEGSNNCSIINDCYNSDVTSLQIAIGVLAHQHQYDKKTLILSDILQSRQNKKTLYSTVNQLIKKNNIKRLIAIGTTIQKYQDLFQNLQTDFYTTVQDFLANPPIFQQEAILVKGARGFGFERIVQHLEQKIHTTILSINLNALAHNLQVYKQCLSPSTKIMVMVKALSYGSGSFEIANLLQFNRVDYLAVAYVDEGVALRKAGISLPIMVLNPQINTFATLYKYRLEPEIYSLPHLQKFLHFSANLANPKVLPIHIKLDTGMHRLGFEKQDIPLLIKVLKNKPNIKVGSIFSHLAASDEAIHDGFSSRQITQFTQLSKQLLQAFKQPILRHILNSTGIVRFPTAQFDMVRLGLGLYGVDTSNEIQNKLLTVSSLKTYISQIKTITPPETIGYSRKGKINQPTKIATVSIGYGDGLNRNLSNGKGKMLVNGKLASIIGNICMDMCMLDVTHIPAVKEGQEVLVFGENLPVQQVAEWMNTIPYEVFTNVSSRVKRVYYQE